MGPSSLRPEPSVSRLRELSGEPLVRRFESEQAFPALPHFPPPSSAFPRPPPPSSSDLVALLALALPSPRTRLRRGSFIDRPSVWVVCLAMRVVMV